MPIHKFICGTKKHLKNQQSQTQYVFKNTGKRVFNLMYKKLSENLFHLSYFLSAKHV